MLAFRIWTFATVLTFAVVSFAVAQGASGLSVINIAVIDADGGNLEVVAREPEAGLVFNGSPAWSPDATKIAFDSITRDVNWPNAKLFTVEVTGANKGRLFDLGYGTAPCYSPDGSQITLTLNADTPLGGEPGIWVMNADSSGREFLVPGWFARWSPNGRQLVYTDALGSASVRLLDLRSGKVQHTGLRCEGRPRIRWGPGGDQIAAVCQTHASQLASATCSLSIADLESADSRFQALLAGQSNSPLPYNIGMFDWSHDGKQFAIRMSSPAHPPGIYVFEPDGPAEPWPLILDTDRQKFWSPTWSPDGKRLAITVNEYASLPGDN